MTEKLTQHLENLIQTSSTDSRISQDNINILLQNLVKDISQQGVLSSTKGLIVKLLDRISVNPAQTGIIDLAEVLNEKGITAEILPEVWDKIAMRVVEQKEYMHIS